MSTGTLGMNDALRRALSYKMRQLFHLEKFRSEPVKVSDVLNTRQVHTLQEDWTSGAQTIIAVRVGEPTPDVSL
jgi:hypothetical protein